MRLKIGIKNSGKADRGILSVWIQAFRLPFVTPSFIPAMLCTAIAWSRGGAFDPVAFVLVILGVTINSLGLNMLDDVIDYLNAVDHYSDLEKNPYTGGSGVLTGGLLTVRQLSVAVAICFSITSVIGIILAFMKGWPVIVFGLFGILSSIFYTLPPIRFGYRGFGELGLLVNFGPVIGLGAYYVQTQRLDVEPLVTSLVLGFLMWSMIVINEIPDYEEDRRGGKWNLVARFGKKAGIGLYFAGMIAAYGTILITVLIGMTPSYLLLGLLSLPVAFKSAHTLLANYEDRMAMAPANLGMLWIYTITGSALISAYVLYGYI